MPGQTYEQIKVLSTGGFNLGDITIPNMMWSINQRVVVGRGGKDSFRVGSSGIREHERALGKVSGIYRIELTSRGEAKLNGKPIRLPHTGRGFTVINNSEE